MKKAKIIVFVLIIFTFITLWLASCDQATNCEHSYTSKATTIATCTEDGVRTYTCSKCDNSYTKKISATGHSYTEKITAEATCTEDGEKTFTCSKCNDSYTAKIPATGHNYTENITTEATCTEDGIKTFTCSACNDSYTEKISATGHNWNNATCVLPKTCSVCNITEGNALGHYLSNGICTRCGVDTTNYYIKLRNFIRSHGAKIDNIYLYKYTAYYDDVSFELWLSYFNDNGGSILIQLKPIQNGYYLDLPTGGDVTVYTSEQLTVFYTNESKNTYDYMLEDYSKNKLFGTVDASSIQKHTSHLPYETFEQNDLMDSATDASNKAMSMLHIQLLIFNKFLNESLDISIDKFGYINY